MQKTVDRYESRMNEMQKQIESLTANFDVEQNLIRRLNTELTDLTDLHQLEMSTTKGELKKLEDKLLYNFKEYWTEMVDKLEKLDTRVSRTLRQAGGFSASSLRFSRRPKSNKLKRIHWRPRKIRIA